MKIYNKSVRREFTPLEKIEAGIVLTGAEVKSIRQGRVRLEDAYVKVRGSEAYLINADISPYEHAQQEQYDPKRIRKLLLHKKELVRLKTKLDSGGNLTIIPIVCYNKNGVVKLEIALAKGKKTWEKKRVEKERDEKRRVEKELKEAMKE